MQERDAKPLVEMTTARANVYRLFSTVFFKELTEEQIDILASWDYAGMADLDGAIAEGAHMLRRYFRRMRSEMREELAVDYAHIFYAAGSSKHEKRAVPYESVFTSIEGLLMQEARDEVYRYMLDEQVEPDTDLHIPEDHVAFLFDFMAMLCERFNCAVEDGDTGEAARLLEVQRGFHAEHLANWIERLAEAIGDCARTKFYAGMAKMMQGFIGIDGDLLEETAACLC